MDAEVLTVASPIKDAPTPGIHLVQDAKGEWIPVLITTGERINKVKNLTKDNPKQAGWYWAIESDPTTFIGPFDDSVRAVTDCAHTLQGHDKFVFERDSEYSVKRVPTVEDLEVPTGIHSIERQNGEKVAVCVLHSDEAPGNNLPDGFYWSADYAKHKATGPFLNPRDALLDAVRIIQEWKPGQTAVLNVEVKHVIPEGTTIH